MPWVKIVIILCLILVNGFFSLAEMAIVSARKARLQQAADAGREGARVALELKQDAGRFLSTVQIGITAINVLASVLGGATLAETIDHWGLRRRLAGAQRNRDQLCRRGAGNFVPDPHFRGAGAEAHRAEPP